MDTQNKPSYGSAVYVAKLVKSFQSQSRLGLQGPTTVFSPLDLSGILRLDNLSITKKTKRQIKDEVRLSQARKENEQTAKSFMPSTRALLIHQRESTGESLSQTDLYDEVISCFDVSGEKRLCLPQIFKTVLHPFSEQELADACCQLNLYVASCSSDQLKRLKSAGVLPQSVENCGLVTKSDAERLISKLLSNGQNDYSVTPFSVSSFKVYHQCFGSCCGLLDPELYTSEDSLCIRCTECGRLFKIHEFVCHSHSSRENAVCHWGFDRKNWRSYLLCAPDQESVAGVKQKLEDVKRKFLNPAPPKQVRHIDYFCSIFSDTGMGSLVMIPWFANPVTYFETVF